MTPDEKELWRLLFATLTFGDTLSKALAILAKEPETELQMAERAKTFVYPEGKL